MSKWWQHWLHYNLRGLVLLHCLSSAAQFFTLIALSVRSFLHIFLSDRRSVDGANIHLSTDRSDKYSKKMPWVVITAWTKSTTSEKFSHEVKNLPLEAFLGCMKLATRVKYYFYQIKMHYYILIPWYIWNRLFVMCFNAFIF